MLQADFCPATSTAQPPCRQRGQQPCRSPRSLPRSPTSPGSRPSGNSQWPMAQRLSKQAQVGCNATASTRGGNRQLNKAIHTIAITHLSRATTEGRRYYDKKLAEGKPTRSHPKPQTTNLRPRLDPPPNHQPHRIIGLGAQLGSGDGTQPRRPARTRQRTRAPT